MKHLRVLCVLRGLLSERCRHCTLCSREISFCAKFCSDSDHSRRALAPEFFSTLLVNSTNFCTLARTLRLSLAGQRNIFLEKRRVQAKVHLDVAFLLVDTFVKFRAMDQKFHRRRLQSPLPILRHHPKIPISFKQVSVVFVQQVGRDEHRLLGGNSRPESTFEMVGSFQETGCRAKYVIPGRATENGNWRITFSA